MACYWIDQMTVIQYVIIGIISALMVVAVSEIEENKDVWLDNKTNLGKYTDAFIQLQLWYDIWNYVHDVIKLYAW